MKKLLIFLFMIFVSCKNFFAFNLCSGLSERNKICFDVLSEKEILNIIVDETCSDCKIDVLAWVKNLIDFAKKANNLKVDKIVKKIIPFDRKFDKEFLYNKFLENLVYFVMKATDKIEELDVIENRDFLSHAALLSIKALKAKKVENDECYIFFDNKTLTPEEYLLRVMSELREYFLEHSSLNQHPFLYALVIDHVDLVKIFLSKGIKFKDCFYAEGFNEDEDFCELNLLTQIGIGYNSLKILFDFFNDLNTEIFQDYKLYTAAFSAAFLKNHKDIVEYLLQKGIPINPKYNNNEYFYPPLLMAIQAGNLEMVKFLVDRGADVNVVYCDGAVFYPLRLAVEGDYFDIAKFLIEKGAFIDYELFLIKKCNNELKQLLKEAAAFYRKSELHIAVVKGEFETVKNLLDQGVDPNITDRDLRTPLSLISFFIPFVDDEFCPKIVGQIYSKVSNQEYLKIIDLLLSYGADINAEDCCGNTLLFFSIKKSCNMKFIENLIQKGALINHKNYKGQTPLIAAIKRNSGYVDITIIEKLLEFGADPSIIDNKGKTALDYVKEYISAKKDYYYYGSPRKAIELLEKYINLV